MRAEVVSMACGKSGYGCYKKSRRHFEGGWTGCVSYRDCIWTWAEMHWIRRLHMKIYAAKGRPSDNPLIVHIAELEQSGKDYDRDTGGSKDPGREILAGAAYHDSPESGYRATGDYRWSGQCCGSVPK